MTRQKPEAPDGKSPSDFDAGDGLRQTCPVRPAHKAVFPAAPWRWQPDAASWVWAVLKTAGGKMPAEALTRTLAQLRGLSHRQANGLRNRGLFVLEAFGLIEIGRLPAVEGNRSGSAYDYIQVVCEDIDGKAGREKKETTTDNRTEMSGQGFERAEQ